jgi:hypothetical protein
MLGSREDWTSLGRLACCRSLCPIRGRISLDGFVLSFATIMRILKGEVRHVLVGFGQLEHLQARLRQHHILCLRARFLGTVEEPRNMENGSSGSLIHLGRQTFESVLWFHIGASEAITATSSLSNAIERELPACRESLADREHRRDGASYTGTGPVFCVNLISVY